jgi:heme-degrading monooxygenase HmoA
MITVIVSHVFCEENQARAEDYMARNMEASKRAAGFVSRRILYSTEDRLRCYSVTSWKTREHLERFRTRPDRPQVEIEGAERRIYEITPEGRVLLYTRTTSEICEENAE